MSISEAINLDLTCINSLQPLKIFWFSIWHNTLQIIYMRFCEFKFSDETSDLIKPGEYSKLALEWIFSEECFKNSMIRLSIIVPVSITHCNLIMICQERVSPVIGRFFLFFLINNRILILNKFH